MIDFGKRGMLVLLLLLLGCTSTAEEPAAESSDLSPRSAEPVVESTAVPTIAPTAIPPTLTVIPTATAQADEAPPTAEVVEALPTATSDAVAVVQEEGVFFGRTDEGALFQGAADAPLTLIDYSDFL